jgi:hypothetical protein
MYLFRRKLLINAFKLFDLLNVGMCLILSIFVFSNKVSLPSFSQVGLIEIKILNLVFFIIALITSKIIFSNFKLYHSKRLSEQSREISDVLKATSIGALLILIEAIFFRINFITVPVIFFFWICCTIITITSRFLLRYFLRRIRSYGRNLRHVLIIGTNPRAIQFAEKLLASPELGYRLVGFVDDEWIGIESFRKTRYRLVCDLIGFKAFIREGVVDEVIVSLPVKSFYDQASRIISICEEQGIVVRYLSSIFDVESRKIKIKESENYSLIPLSSDTIYGFPPMAKRIMDIALSFVISSFSIPIFIFVPIAIKLTSSGPVFYTQERIGLGKRKFRLYKFRTMKEDAEKKLADLEDQNEVSGPVFKIKDDPRVTSVGKYLRKFSIDELPPTI